MTVGKTIEPRRAVNGTAAAPDGAAREGELATLVRRWMASGGNRNGRATAPADEPVDEPATARVVVPDPAPAPPEEQASPRLPLRGTLERVERTGRLAVLVDARRMPTEAVGALLATLSERGAVTVCRAYGDWTRPDLGEWAGRMRRHGLHSFHHFADDDDQVLVAMAIDAVDVARDAAVDEVVLAGDHLSTLPLVHRLHTAGVRVVLVGSGDTPHEVRAACDDFIATDGLTEEPRAPGRHRA